MLEPWGRLVNSTVFSVVGKKGDDEMLTGFFKFFKELDRRVKVTLAGTGIHSWSQRLSGQYKQLYAQDLGADPVELGVLNSVGSALSSVVSVPLGWLAEKYGVKKVMLLALGFGFVSATIYALAGSWWMLIPAVILAGMVRIMPLTDVIFINYTKPALRATVMSFSRVLWGTLNIFAPMTAAVIVATFGGINADGIRPLYLIQVVLIMVVLLFFATKLPALPGYINQKTRTKPAKGNGFLRDFQDLFAGEEGLKRWIAVRLIRQFAMSLAMPYSPLWKVDVKGATPYILGTMGTAAVIVSLLLQVPVGRVSDRIGRKKAFFLLRPFAYLGTFLLILAPSPEFLILVGLLEGIGQVSMTPFITMQWEMVPKEKRGRWFGIEGLLGLASIPAAVIGGFLWQQGLMTEVLLLPMLLEVAILIPVLITIPDTLKRNNL
jgi:MFS family permease